MQDAQTQGHIGQFLHRRGMVIAVPALAARHFRAGHSFVSAIVVQSFSLREWTAQPFNLFFILDDHVWRQQRIPMCGVKDSKTHIKRERSQIQMRARMRRQHRICRGPVAEQYPAAGKCSDVSKE